MPSGAKICSRMRSSQLLPVRASAMAPTMMKPRLEYAKSPALEAGGIVKYLRAIASRCALTPFADLIAAMNAGSSLSSVRGGRPAV